MAIKCCQKTRDLLGFSGEPVQRFTEPQVKWPFDPVVWITYRITLAAYFLAWLIALLLAWGEPPFYQQADTKAKWLIYVSNWSYLLEVVYLVSHAAGNIYYYTRPRRTGRRTVASVESDSEAGGDAFAMSMAINDTTVAPPQGDLPWYFKFIWLCQTTVFSSALFVAINFYVLVFNPAEDVLSVYNFHVHGVNLIIICLDMLLGAQPMRILHMIYPMSFAFIYFIFTLIYQRAGGLNEVGGTAIYPGFLDWGAEPTTSLIVMSLTVLVGAPVLHTLWYLVYRARNAISKRCDCCQSF